MRLCATRLYWSSRYAPPRSTRPYGMSWYALPRRKGGHMNSQDIKNLKRRYFVWLYKTTKEAFDKYERKFTQTDIDQDILLEMENTLLGAYLPHEKKALEKLINDFREYIFSKEKACLELKYQGKKTNPDFIFLDMKLNAIEKLISKELGRRTLEEIKGLYESEMIGRILRSMEH